MYQWDKIKVIGNYDTVVVGGGTAGAAAGIRCEFPYKSRVIPT